MEKQAKNKRKDDNKFFNQYTTEERLKIIADLIIDRLLETKNKENGNRDK